MATWIKGLIGFIVFFGIIIGYVIETKYLGAYLSLAGVIKNGLLLGAMFGGFFGFLLKGQGQDQDSRFSIFAGLLVLGLACGPLFVSLINRVTCTGSISKEYELIKVEPIMKTNIGIIKGEVFKPDGHRITISKEGETYDLEIGKDLTPYQIDENRINLNICTGGLGFEFVEPIKSTSPPKIS